MAPACGIKRKSTICPLQENTIDKTTPSPSGPICTTQDSQSQLAIAPGNYIFPTRFKDGDQCTVYSGLKMLSYDIL